MPKKISAKKEFSPEFSVKEFVAKQIFLQKTFRWKEMFAEKSFFAEKKSWVEVALWLSWSFDHNMDNLHTEFLTYFFLPKFFGNQIFLDQNFYGPKFFGTNIFWTQNFSDTNFQT